VRTPLHPRVAPVRSPLQDVRQITAVVCECDPAIAAFFRTSHMTDKMKSGLPVGFENHEP